MEMVQKQIGTLETLSAAKMINLLGLFNVFLLSLAVVSRWLLVAQH